MAHTPTDALDNATGLELLAALNGDLTHLSAGVGPSLCTNETAYRPGRPARALFDSV
jgi:hypothetical protein